MVARIRSRLSYANIASSLALFLALTTGTVYAANEWTGANIVDQSLTAADLAMNTIGTGRILDNSLTANDLGADSVTSSELADDAVDSAAVIAGSLTAADLATDSVQATEIADNAIDGGEIIDDSLTAADLAPSAVTASELAANAVTSADVANNSLTLADIVGVDLNPGHVSFSAGGVANGRCTQVDLGVGGTLAGQLVVINVLAPIQNGVVLLGARVPSNVHVTANLCNFSGAAMQAIVDLPIRVVTFG